RVINASGARHGPRAILRRPSLRDVPHLVWRCAMRRLLFAVLLLAIASPALAQFQTATVLGTVRDSTGAVVPGATISLLNTGTGVASTKATDGHGNFEFFTVPIGIYKLTAE